MAELAQDIQEVGLRNPLVVFEGQILHGRARYAACQHAGVEPRFVTFEGSSLDAAKLLVSENFRRRHLLPNQLTVARNQLSRRAAYRPAEPTPEAVHDRTLLAMSASLAELLRGRAALVAEGAELSPRQRSIARLVRRQLAALVRDSWPV